MHWHTLDSNKIFSETGSSEEGLDNEEAKNRLQKHGPNELISKGKKPAWKIALHQFTDFMIIILLAAAIVSSFIGDLTDAVIIIVIVFLNAIIGFVQEFRAEKAMESLKQMATPKAKVRRNNQVHEIPSAEVVPGDIVSIEAGDIVPADLRLIHCNALKIMEASLTGESVPIDKRTEKLDDENLSLGDRTNIAYKSTQVTNGNAEGLVIATGMETELGKIASMLEEKEEMTPLQRRMKDFGRKLTIGVIIICLALFGIGILRGEQPITMMLLAISLAVAAIPEALPALITIGLSVGAKRLVKKNALTRKLTAVETLGSVTFICTDKTGTLTRNQMEVVGVHPRQKKYGEVPDSLLPLGMQLNHSLNFDGKEFKGDPTEIAMVVHAQKENNGENKEFPKTAEIPFDSDRKRMTTIHEVDGKFFISTKGAVENIVDILSDTHDRDIILGQADELSAEGKRVIAFAHKIDNNIPEDISADSMETNLEFDGLVALIDPPREEIPDAISECKTAGIKPVMITGDHIQTASAIAKEIGLLSNDGKILSGERMAEMSEQEFESEVEQISVYARVSPKQKMDIVKTLQRKEHFVAMTGDGVNDAPSLKKANIGIAMGIAGTDVSKEAAHMILLDDNFATIVKAIREGRRIYDNIRKFIRYIMTCNGAEILIIFIAPLLGLPIPLLPVHILWINLVTDGLPGLALSVEKAEKNIMQRKPRKSNENFFARGVGTHIIWVGIFMAALTIGLQAWVYKNGNENWQTMVFTALAFCQLGHVLAISSEQEYIYKKGLMSNPQLLIAVTATLALQLVVVYLPAANRLLKTQPLSLVEILICGGIAFLVFHAVELEKWLRNRKTNKNNN